VLLAIAALAAGACATPERVEIGQVMRMGQFVLRADSVEVYSRQHQGVPLEVQVHFTIGGGNRFDRLDFAETLSRKGGIFITASSGWRDRCWLLGEGDDQRNAYVQSSPPLGSSGFTMDIRNPYGEPKRFVLDLGK
jgi:hypothetical protein